MLEPGLHLCCYVDRGALREHTTPTTPVLTEHGQFARALEILECDEATGITSFVEACADGSHNTTHHYIGSILQFIGVCQFDTLRVAEVVEHNLELVQWMGGEVDAHQVALFVQSFDVTPSCLTLWDGRCGDLYSVEVAKQRVLGLLLLSLIELAVAHNNLASFIKTYPAFSLFLIGTICFFFAHNMINDFMIQIIRSLGGNETQLGYANFLQAILELPVMAVIGFILKKITSDRLLIISGTAFFVKILILIFATNMAMMYLSQSCQLFAYAVFIPAAAYYVSSTMNELDQVKGQAFVTSAITIGGVFSNLLSGVILDHMGIKTMLICGTSVCAIGVIIAIYAMKKLPKVNTEI